MSLSKGEGKIFECFRTSVNCDIEAQIPKITEKSSKWGIGNLKDWFEDYNSRNPSDTCPSEILTPTSSRQVNASPPGYLLTYPPFPPPFPSTPYYPKLPPITSSYLVIEDDLHCTE